MLSYTEQYNVLEYIDMNQHADNFFKMELVLTQQLKLLTQRYDQFDDNDRLIFTFDSTICNTRTTLECVKVLQTVLNTVDIPTFFVVLLLNRTEHNKELRHTLDKHNHDMPILIEYYTSTETPIEPVNVEFADTEEKEHHYLTKSKTFCMYPWMHLNINPDGSVMPCCEASEPLGDSNADSLETIWNSDAMKTLRVSMLTENLSATCVKCYESEIYGLESGRLMANGKFKHHVHKIHNTTETGHLDKFELIRWDVRFSNICNLSCRSCGPTLSSNWYKDQLQLEPNFVSKHPVAVIKAGRHKLDIQEQLIPHLDFVEHIYFAGGEPLIMDEHYWILDELEKRNRFDVILYYNTNFTNLKYKGTPVFERWKRFKTVIIDASLDAMGPHAEYMRKGTDWSTIEQNRREMMSVCPDARFGISSTLSVLNMWHLPDFHRSWIEQGLVEAKNIKFHLLLQPTHLRIDIAHKYSKEQVRQKYLNHIDWLTTHTGTKRQIDLWTSAIDFMMGQDNQVVQREFWDRTAKLDKIRNENIFDVIPEIAMLCQ